MESNSFGGERDSNDSFEGTFSFFEYGTWSSSNWTFFFSKRKMIKYGRPELEFFTCAWPSSTSTLDMFSICDNILLVLKSGELGYGNSEPADAGNFQFVATVVSEIGQKHRGSSDGFSGDRFGQDSSKLTTGFGLVQDEG